MQEQHPSLVLSVFFEVVLIIVFSLFITYIVVIGTDSFFVGNLTVFDDSLFGFIWDILKEVFGFFVFILSKLFCFFKILFNFFSFLLNITGLFVESVTGKLQFTLLLLLLFSFGVVSILFSFISLLSSPIILIN